MAMTRADKLYLRRMIGDAVRAALVEWNNAQCSATQGGYDGATPVVDDDWCDDAQRREHRALTRRVGFDCSQRTSYWKADHVD